MRVSDHDLWFLLALLFGVVGCGLIVTAVAVDFDFRLIVAGALLIGAGFYSLGRALAD